MSKTTGRHARGLLAALAVAVAACASDPYRDSWPAPASPQGTIVWVANNGWEPVAIYLMREGASIKLGTIEGHAAQHLLVPAAHLGSGQAIRLQALRRVSRERYESDKFDVAAGQRVEWRLELRLALSSLEIE